MTWELLFEFVTRCATDGVRNLAVGMLLLVLTRRWLRRRLRHRRIDVRGRALDRRQILHEVKHSLVVTAFSAAQILVLLNLAARGLVDLPAGLGPHGWVGALATVVGLTLFNDLWFYAIHRLLHTPWLFRHIHAVHHRSVDVNPMTSFSFHLVEAALLTGWLIPIALIFPLPFVPLMVMQVLGLANNVMAHLGFELLPRWWVRTPILRWSNSATYHSLHHQRFRGNYGLTTRVWDRLFGTEIDDYEKQFVRAHADA